MRESIYFYKERSVGQLFGFHQRVLQPHLTKTYRSAQTMNILKVSTIRLECYIISCSYVDNTPNHTLHEFGINVPPGYKMTVTLHIIINLSINCDEIKVKHIYTFPASIHIARTQFSHFLFVRLQTENKHFAVIHPPYKGPVFYIS